MSLENQEFVIVGGTSGIGLATAQMAVASGALVTVIGRNPERMETCLRALGPKARGMTADACDRAALRDCFERIGPFDHLVLSASGARGAGKLADLDPAELEAGFNLKFWPQWNALHASSRTIRTGGSITIVTAASARTGNPGTSGLAAINGALNAMVLPLARELGPTRINAVSPGVIDTPWWDARPKAMKDSFFESVSSSTPARRVGRPDEVAAAILFLASSEYTTGIVLDVDGGLRTTSP